MRMTLAALAVLAALPAAAQDRVGVAAAVNRDATLERGGAARTVVIGNDVAFRDRIITSASGLVQVLFVDGSAFTVGANSRVVIDEFAYNPSTGAGALAAEVTRGALRFVGGGLSKGGNTVQVRTPAGTLGVRGAIVDIDTEPGCLRDGRCPRLIATLVYGREMSLTPPGGAGRRIWERGNAFVVFDGPAGGPAQVEIVPIRQLDLGGLQARLAGRPGQRGGARTAPTDTAVADSGLPAANSARAPAIVRPRPRREVVQTATAPDEEVPGVTDTAQTVAQTVGEQAQAETIREAVVTPDDGSRTTPSGVFGTPPDGYRTAGGVLLGDPARTNLTARDREGLLPATVVQDGSGRAVAVEVGGVTVALPAEQGETPIPRTATSFGPVRGSILRGPGGFAMLYLTPDSGLRTLDPASGAAYVLLGPPTAREVFYPAGGNTARAPLVRTYTFGTEFALRDRGVNARVPLLNPLIAEAFGNAFLQRAAVTPFWIVERADLGPGSVTLHAAMLIQGTGLAQRSMIVSDAGGVYSALASTGADALGIGGTRRGGYRLNAGETAVAMRGGTGSARIENPVRFTAMIGPEGEAFVYSSGTTGGGFARNVTPGESEFIDITLGDPARTPSSPLQYSSVFIPAFLDSTAPAASFARPEGTVRGFAAGMMETGGGGVVAYRSIVPGEFALRFNAAARTIGGTIQVHNTSASDYAAYFRYGFGFDTTGTFAAATNGRSALLDATRYAANSTGPGNAQGGDSTILVTRGGATIPHRPFDGPFGTGVDPGTYVVSSGLVPQPRLFADADVTPCACTFMHWGWWGTQTEFTNRDLPGGRRRDIVHLGTWTAADLPTAGELPAFGTARYVGHAIGNVARTAGTGTAQYVAAGTMALDFDFGARTGTLGIAIDGRSMSAPVATGGTPGAPNIFTGLLSGDLGGRASGSFARGPGGSAQGVLGVFDGGAPGYAITGTFMGERLAP